MKKLREIKDLEDSGEDVVFCNADKEYLEEFEEEWIERMGEEEIPIEGE